MGTVTASGKMFSLKLPRGLYDRLSTFAEGERRSKAFVVKDALEMYLAAQVDTHDTGKITGLKGEAGSNA